MLSVERHILRNYIYLHALETGQPLPIGSQNAELLDTQFEDEDVDSLNAARPGLFDDYDEEGDDTEGDEEGPGDTENLLRTPADFRRRAAEVYGLYRTSLARRFKWLRPALFTPDLKDHLAADAEALTQVLAKCGDWDPARDAQLDALQELALRRHPDEKLLIFSQFADTVRYLARELKRRGVSKVAAVTGGNANPAALAWRFSPVSNGKRNQISPEEELRLLIATDVLSEGQNLQDAAIVVNYDLPWAIIRLIQRAGRVDRIGQQAQTILCYTFWPAEGIERLINLRGRLLQRLRENGEVVGVDEAFFEDAEIRVDLHDLYHERAGVLDGDDEGEVDLVSYAHQIWKNATDANPELLRVIPRLPAVTYATKSHANLRVSVSGRGPTGRGALVYVKTGEGVSALAWLDEAGQSVTHSQRTILDAAACALDEPGLPRQPEHHELVAAGIRHILSETSAASGGQLGQRSSARFRTYERLRTYLQAQRGTLFEHAPRNVEAREALDLIYRYPLTERARDTLNRQLRSGVRDEDLCELVVELFHSERLCVVHERIAVEEPEIICSLGIV